MAKGQTVNLLAYIHWFESVPPPVMDESKVLGICRVALMVNATDAGVVQW